MYSAAANYFQPLEPSFFWVEALAQPWCRVGLKTRHSIYSYDAAYIKYPVKTHLKILCSGESGISGERGNQEEFHFIFFSKFGIRHYRNRSRETCKQKHRNCTSAKNVHNATHAIAMALLSVRQTRALWQNKKPVPTFLYDMKKTIILVFLHRYTKTDWWGRPLVPEILGKPDPVRARRRFSIDICVTYTSINTNRKSAKRCPMSLLINSVRCPEPSKKRLKDSKMAVFC